MSALSVRAIPAYRTWSWRSRQSAATLSSEDRPTERKKKGNILMQSRLFQLLTRAFKLFNTGATVADAAVKAIKYLKKERKTERVDSNQTRQSQQELLSPSKMLFFLLLLACVLLQENNSFSNENVAFALMSLSFSNHALTFFKV